MITKEWRAFSTKSKKAVSEANKLLSEFERTKVKFNALTKTHKWLPVSKLKQGSTTMDQICGICADVNAMVACLSLDQKCDCRNQKKLAMVSNLEKSMQSFKENELSGIMKVMNSI